ncbi:sulfate permease, SulP family [Gammaproteobacteria bacterium]
MGWYKHIRPAWWFPRFPVFHNYSQDIGRRDLIAGLTVALFTIPQAMAYALIAGFPPAVGITTAVVASILGAVGGSSEFLVNGPTNAISVMLAANFALYAGKGNPLQQIILLTLMVGTVQIIAGVFRLGRLIRFVSDPVVAGFTAGAGIYIAANQLPAVLGIEKAKLVTNLWEWAPAHNCLYDFLRTLASLHQAHGLSVVVGGGTLLLIWGFHWFGAYLRQRLPVPFLAVITATLITYLMNWGGAEANVKLVQDIQPITREIPQIVWPKIDFSELPYLFDSVIAISLLGSLEAIAIGKMLADRVGHPFGASRQLIGEGICNIGVALVGGFASSGSFTRTAVIFESGAVTRFSVIFSGILVLGIVFLFAPVANHIPIPALAGTLIYVGLKLVNVTRLKQLMQATAADRVALLTTLGSVLFVQRLESALFLGIAVALFMTLRRAEHFILVSLEAGPDGSWSEAPCNRPHYPEIMAVALRGELFFAGATNLEYELKRILWRGTRFLVLNLAHAYHLDVTCAGAIALVAREARAHGGRLILAEITQDAYETFERAGLLQELSEDMIFRSQTILQSSTIHAIGCAKNLLNNANPI